MPYTRLVFSAIMALLLTALSLLPPVTAGAATTISGTVIETMNSAGYTYLLVDTGSQQNWVAIPETTVTKGAKVSCAIDMEMKDFHSTTLNRTFPAIIFSSGIMGDTAKKAAPAKASTESKENSFQAAVAKEQQASGQSASPTMTASGGSAGAVVPFADSRVEKASGDNAITVAEAFQKAAELSGKKVKVRGKVVKVSAAIMGRNWVHLQDGSGDPLQNSHDLVVTTSSEVKAGDIVTAEGTLAANKDFGAGYSYAAIVEQASFSH